jgi:glyoxylase-like metal-dependent hydrolase (beta-lactamase superfamily II)
MKLFSINAGYFKLDGGAMFGVIPKSMWQKANPADDNNMCTWATRCLLIDTGDRRILVDSGIGNKQDEKFLSRYYLHGDDSLEKGLATYGYKPEDITDVFHTHLHFDHCGGSVKKTEEGKLVPKFPNAQYWSNHQHWALAMNPNEREKASFLKENFVPLQEHNVINFVEGDKWIENFSVIHVSGHTEEMMLPLIKYGDKHILFCADLVPSLHHISMPWVMAYDMRPNDTLNEKRQILPEALANNWVLMFQHDPVNECCTLEMTERGIRAKEIFNLSAIDSVL